PTDDHASDPHEHPSPDPHQPRDQRLQDENCSVL
ncbi:hypothetical protein ABH937_001852, partial [Kitasatospora sp. GAS1066B]